MLELTSRNHELEAYAGPKEGQLDLIAREMSALAPTEQQLLRSVEMDAARLEVGAVIGVGSYAEVRRGVYRGTPVAVKTLKAVDARSLQRFRAEILLMKDLRHPNIVMLLGASWSTGRLMMVVELFERGNLADVLEGAQLTWRQKFSMLEDSECRGLLVSFACVVLLRCHNTCWSWRCLSAPTRSRVRNWCGAMSAACWRTVSVVAA